MPSRFLGTARAVVAVFVGAILGAAPGVSAQSPYGGPPMGESFPEGGLPQTNTGDGGFPGAESALASNAGTGFDYRWWFGGEYLLSYTKTTSVPTTLTTSPIASLGILGNPGTQSAFGGKQDFGGISGARFHGGLWLDPCRAYGLDWNVFFLPRQTNSATLGAGAAAVIARPFFDTALNRENSRLVSRTGQFTGSASATYNSFFWGADLGGLVRVYESSTFSLEQTFHFRYLGLEEAFETVDRSTPIAGAGVVYFNGTARIAPANVSTLDRFSTVNRFYGGAAGLRINYAPGRWTLSATARLAVGATQEWVTVEGTTTLENAGPSQTVRPGTLTASITPNRYTQYRLAYSPDVQVSLAYKLTDHLQLSIGYQYLYLSEVARPGDQVNRNIAPGQIPSSQFFGAAANQAPFSIQSSDFWMHGLTAGAMITF